MSESGLSQTADALRPALKREYSQLLKLQEHLQNELQLLQNELGSPLTRGLLEQVQKRADSPVPHLLDDVAQAIGQALDVLRQVEAELLAEVWVEVRDRSLGAITNLPQRLARFLAERDGIPGFTHEVRRDRVRGWVIHWKELDENGVLRGAGQFYERPYAWLDD